MQCGPRLEFACTQCGTPVSFSSMDVKGLDAPLVCGGCQQPFLLSDPDLRRQLRQFEALCRQLRESEEILSDSKIAVQVGLEEVAIPFRLLLTRFNCSLDLDVGGERIEIGFHVEPGRR